MTEEAGKQDVHVRFQVDSENRTKTSIIPSAVNASDWASLESLKSLHEQGFITVTEYKERKSQIIDSMTGTRSVSKNTGRPSVGVSKVRQEFIPPRAPNFENVQEERALQHTYVDGEWKSKEITVRVEKDPFAKGGLRRAHHLQFVNPVHSAEFDLDDTVHTTGILTETSSNRYVAKISIDPDEDREVYVNDVEMQAYCIEWAKRYNRCKPPKHISFIKACLIELISRPGRPLVGVERFIDGPYHKWNNNYGFVNEIDRNTPQTFSHFTYEASRRRVLIVDIQGVGDCYTDPQIHTVDGEGFGKGNLGQKGFEQFLSTHRCNAICKYLGLPLINVKVDDRGTVPVSQLDGSFQTHFNFHDVEVIQMNYFRDGARKNSSRTPLLNSQQQGSQEQSGCCVIV